MVLLLLASKQTATFAYSELARQSHCPFRGLLGVQFSFWPVCSLIRPCRTFGTGGFALCRYQQLALRLLPAGAAVAGWVIFLPLEERALFTAHSEFGLILRLAAFPEHRALRIRKMSPGLRSSIESPFGHRTRREGHPGTESKRRSPGQSRSLGYRSPADRCQRLQALIFLVRPRTPGPAIPHWSCKLLVQINLASTS